jgi:predicted DCC family thiol-disulfide oxidoreductase YuxK
VVELYYDGQCSFCLHSLLLLRRFDDMGHLHFLDGNEPSNVERLSQLTDGQPDLNRAMWAVASGKVYEGYHAFRIALLALPRLRWLGMIMTLPPVALVGPYIYRITAANRRNFGCRLSHESVRR